ncbi:MULTISPECIES: DUF2388 domain-containing protein [unclassified Bdellovibrio]|uniref:DUF2388 domain-containing protein n=1 Tax=unclassified Bdellovibrio TaxID=2633795 RepID=UPI001157DFCE|nr:MULTISPECIES: DUF2388 domain-containing protein [unclassified Bdellovibrio]QDK44099.1 hypothetical protein DOM22_02475 [Bdellovibrio sp. ZAP7]QLY25942.1 DUF2388 domain-containing protein [Bdellovibrio sp. KM01]
MKSVLFVLVSAMSMNAMALEISTSIKITQANQEKTAYEQMLLDAQPDAAIYIASGGKELRPQLARTFEVIRSKNGNKGSNMELAESIANAK